MAGEKEKKIKDIFEMGGETGSFFERVAKEAEYKGYGRLAEVKESKLSKLKSLLPKIKGLLPKIKGKVKEIKEKPQVPVFLRIILPFLIVFQAFFPGMIFGMTITFVIILIVIIVVIVVVAYFTGGAAVAGASSMIMDIIIPIVTVTILFVIVNFIGSPNYFKAAGKIPNGQLIANILLLISSSFAGLIAWKGKRYVSFGVGSGGLIAFLFFIMPFALTYTKPYSICMNLPFISQYCNPREVRVQGPEVVTIPVRGGINLMYGAPDVGVPASTLYAGGPYEYTFTFTNHYSVPITFKLDTSIVSTYATGVKFDFPFNQRIPELNASQFYQDGVLIHPAQLKAEGVQGCPYYEWQISKTQNIPTEEIECARDKPCGNVAKACVAIDYMKCKCVGWVEATCSGALLYLQTEVEHTGYFVGVANLYYSSVNVPPKPSYNLVQGPLSITVEFLPNPYIGSVHYYRNDTSMYVTFRNLGGNVTITSINVTPLITNITTVDKEKMMMLEEIIGTKKEWCREEEIVGRSLPEGREFSLLLCKLTAPHVNTTLTNLTNNQTVELNNVTFDRILYYCNKIKAPTEAQANESVGYTFWSSYWEKIYQGVEESGLCEMLKKGDESSEGELVSSALKYTGVKIEFTYIRRTVFRSSTIGPYTRTEECIELEEKTKT